MKTNHFLAAILYLAVQVSLQTGAAAQLTPQKEQPAANPAPVLTNADVRALLKSGLSPEIVVAKVNASVCDFNTSTTALRELKAAGVPDTIILAMVQAPKGTPRTSSSHPNVESTPTDGPPDPPTRTT